MGYKFLEEYAAFVESRRKGGEDIIFDMTPEGANLLHMAVGVSGEAGEMLDAVKKHTIYGKPLDTANVLEEAGDILFYLQGILTATGYTLDDAVQHNTEKLTKRYKTAYSNEAAVARADKATG
jgi:NTP pyrophosphatase (non-canonical NTP hydrolase)